MHHRGVIARLDRAITFVLVVMPMARSSRATTKIR
jgi:hypothetical protein